MIGSSLEKFWLFFLGEDEYRLASGTFLVFMVFLSVEHSFIARILLNIVIFPLLPFLRYISNTALRLITLHSFLLVVGVVKENEACKSILPVYGNGPVHSRWTINRIANQARRIDRPGHWFRKLATFSRNFPVSSLQKVRPRRKPRRCYEFSSGTRETHMILHSREPPSSLGDLLRLLQSPRR